MDERYQQSIQAWDRVNAFLGSEVDRPDMQKILDDFDSVYEFLITRPDSAPPTSGLIEQQKYFKKLYPERLD